MGKTYLKSIDGDYEKSSEIKDNKINKIEKINPDRIKMAGYSFLFSFISSLVGGLSIYFYNSNVKINDLDALEQMRFNSVLMFVFFGVPTIGFFLYGCVQLINCNKT